MYHNKLQTSSIYNNTPYERNAIFCVTNKMIVKPIFFFLKPSCEENKRYESTHSNSYVTISTYHNRVFTKFILFNINENITFQQML